MPLNLALGIEMFVFATLVILLYVLSILSGEVHWARQTLLAALLVVVSFTYPGPQEITKKVIIGCLTGLLLLGGWAFYNDDELWLSKAAIALHSNAIIATLVYGSVLALGILAKKRAKTDA